METWCNGKFQKYVKVILMISKQQFVLYNLAVTSRRFSFTYWHVVNAHSDGKDMSFKIYLYLTTVTPVFFPSSSLLLPYLTQIVLLLLSYYKINFIQICMQSGNLESTCKRKHAMFVFRSLAYAPYVDDFQLHPLPVNNRISSLSLSKTHCAVLFVFKLLAFTKTW